jgi:predicted phage baseplate assembly protein
LGVFQDRPQPEDGLYLGFGNDLSGHTLAISLGCRVEGIGVDPNNPPLSWETWDGDGARWVPLRLELDTTGGLNRDGLVVVHLPYAAVPTNAGGEDALWVRARVLQPRPGQPGYSASPRILRVGVESLGAVVPASHASRITGEELGLSDGSPGQRFQLHSPPILPRRDGEALEVEEERGQFEPWLEVPDFGRSGPRDPHYRLDAASGAIELGPRIRSPQGEEIQHGRVPPTGHRVRFSSYRTGGGLSGNVGARTLTVLQASIPYIAWVSNFEPAVGGTEAEDLEHAKWRVPSVLHARDRAVTPEDFEVLARKATSGIARARCLPVGNGVATPNGLKATLPGTVRLQLVPALPAAEGPLRPEQLEVPARIRHEVQTFLDDRRLLTSELLLEHPSYTWVSILARVRPRRRANRARIERETTAALYRFVHPTTGGTDGEGWPFGRELFAGEVYSLLQGIDGVDFVEEVTLHTVNPTTRDFGPPSTRLAPVADGLLASYEHRVRVE